MSKPTPDDPRSPPESAPAEDSRAPGAELRLVDRKAFVGLGAFDVAPGLRIADLALQIPNVTFPFNVTGGASRYQKQRCLFGQLDLEIAPARLKEAEEKLLQNGPELARLHLHLRAGFIEAEGALRAGGKEPVPFTCRIAFDGAGEGVAARAFDVRLYGPTEIPAPLVGHALAQAAARAQIAPGVEPRGFGAVAASPLGELLRRTVPQKGFRLPEMTAARLGSALVSPQGITLRFSAGAPPPGGLADEELLLAVEGAHAFEEGERLLEAGQLQRAREFFLRAGELAQAHPFATERLIGLLLGDPDVSDYALDLVRALQARRPLSPAPLWMEALLRLARKERQLSAQRFLDLAALARGRGEEASAFWAAQAAANVAGHVDAEPKAAQLAVRALHESLGLRPDHFPSLLALAQQAERAGDDAAALRAWRRLTAVAKDATQAARAHVRLGELCARVEKDLAGARLHYDAALRLQPDDADALLGLADLCARSDEPLRALRALDRVRELNPKDAQLAGRAELEAGAVYEHALNQLENARLRYLEAARALPGEVEPLVRLGRVDERMSRVPEAVEVLTQALELGDGKPAHLAHEAHRILARLQRDRLHDGAKQRAHLEAAVKLKPDDAEAWEELVPLFRADEAHGSLAEALFRASPRAAELRPRVAMLVESAELLRLRLSRPDEAKLRYQEALALEPRNRPALEGVLALDEQQGDMGAACEHLRVLLELAPPGPARLPLLRRLAAAARDGKKDLDLAARATKEILALAPDDLASLSDLVTLQRRRGDLPGLAEALESWARGCERSGDPASTAAALRELAQLFDGRLGRRDDALSALEKAHALAPQDLGVLGDLAELSLRAGRHRLARYATRALLGLLPPEGAPTAPTAQRRADLHDRLSRAAEAVGDLAEAIGALEEAYRLVPDEVFADRLDALYALARRDDSRIDLARRRGAALARDGQGPAASAVLAQAAGLARAAGDLAGAMRDFTAALSADPTGASALANLDALADLAAASGRPGEAAGHLAKRAALTADPRAAARFLVRAAQLCLGLDEPRALSLLASAAARDPQFAPARASLADRRARSGDLGAAWREAEAALDVDPKDPDALDAAALASLERSAARWAEQAGDAAASARLWGRYLQRRPDDADALHARVSLLRTLGDAPALAAALETLESRSPGPAGLALARELAHLYERDLGRVELAAAAHRRILKHQPDDREALAALARLLIGPSEIDERVAVLGQLAGLAKSGEEAAAIHLQRGQALLHALRFADAAQAFTQAARTAPDPLPALDALVSAAEEAGQAQVALGARRERAELSARRSEPGAAAALLDVGSRYLASGSFEEARLCLTHMLALTPEPELARAAHGRLAEIGKARSEPREVLEHQLALAQLVTGNDKLAALREAAEAALSLGNHAAARDALLGALSLSPREATVARALVQVQRQLGDVEGEVESLGLLARLESDPAAATELHLRAAQLLRKDHPARAEASLRQALTLQPGRTDARRVLLELVVARGEVAEAAKLHEDGAAHELHAEAAAQALLRAASLRETALSDREGALRLTRAAFARAPELPEAIAALGERAYLAGATNEAAPLLARTLELVDGRAEPERWVSLALALAELRTEQSQAALAIPVLQKALELAPWRPDVARALFLAEKSQDARAALQRLVRAVGSMHPSSATHALLIEAADASQQLGDASLAARLLEESLATAGNDRDAIEARLIGLHLELGHPRGAVSLLRAQAERARSRGDELAALASLEQAAQLLQRAGDANEAAELLGQLASLQIARAQPLPAARSLLRRGQLLREKLGKLEAAESELRRAMELDPRDLVAVREAQQVARARGDAAGEAELLGVEHERLDEGSARARVLLRRAELERGPLRAPARAEESLRAALSLDPSFSEARDLYEELLRASHREGELAQSLAARAQGAAPGIAVAYLREAAHLFTNASQLEAAADALDQARALAPSDEGLALAAAEALTRAGRSVEAALIDSALLARDPSREPSFSRELARREQAGDVRGQATLSEARALSEPPEPAAPRFLEAARLYDLCGEPEAARRCELWAFERAPGDTAAFGRVVARHQGERHLRVLDGILRRRAQAVESEAGELHVQRARLLAEHDELDGARDALDDALSQATEGTAYRDALILRADLEAQANGAAAAARFDERLAQREDLPAVDRVRIFARLADTRAAAGRDADAAALWESALTGASRDASASLYEKLSQAYARLGDPTRQAEVLLARAQSSPAERVALLRAAVELVPEGKLARRALEGLAEAGGDPASLLKLARLELADGEARGRDRLVEAARAAVVPSVQAGLLLEAAELFGRAKDAPRARGLRAEARRADPNHLEALRAASVDLREDGEWTDRRDVLAALVELEPALAARTSLRRELAELLVEKDPESAHAALLAWARLSEGPEQLVAWQSAEALARKLDSSSQLAEALEQRASLEPTGAAALLMEAAQAWRTGGELARARAALHRAASLETTGVTALRALVELARDSKDSEELARSEEALAARLPAPEQAEALYRASQAWTAADRADAALLALRGAVERAPSNVAWQRQLADAALALKQNDLAQEALLRAAKEAPASEQAELYRRAAQLAGSRGDTAAEAASWRALWERDHLDSEAFAHLAALLSDQGNATELAQLHQARAEASPSATSWSEAASAWEAAHDASAAIAAHRAALAQSPDDLALARALGSAAEKAGDVAAQELALEVQGKRESRPAVRAEALARIATLRRNRGDAPGALQALRAATDADPKPDRIEKLAEALEAAGDVAEAAAQLARLPQSGAAMLRRRAQLLARAKQPSKAAEALLEALESDEKAAPELRALLPELSAVERTDVLGRWARVAPRDEKVALFLEQADLLQGDACRVALEQAFEVAPVAEAPFAALREMLVDGDHDRELAALYEKRAEALKDPQERGLVLQELGELYEGTLEALPEAYDAYERSLRAHPANAGVQRDLAELAFELGRDPRAVELFEVLLQSGPHALQPHFLERLSDLAIRNKRPADAVRHIEARLKLGSTLALRQAFLVQARASRDRAAELRALAGLFETPELADAERTGALRELAALEREAGLRGVALEHQVLLVQRAPDDRAAWRDLRELAKAESDPKRELEALTRLAALEPEPHAQAMMHLARAELLGARKDHAAAAEAALAAHALTPGDELALREALRHAEAGNLAGPREQAALALYELAGADAVKPQLRGVAQALVDRGELAKAYALLTRVRDDAPADHALLAQLVSLSDKLGRLEDHLSLARELALESDDAEAAKTLRSLAARAEHDLEDLALAAELADEAFALAPANDDELSAQAERLAKLHRGREAALARAELARRNPGDRARWTEMANAARDAKVEPLLRAAESLEEFLSGQVPERPSEIGLESAVRAELLGGIGAGWQSALAETSASRWAALPAAPSTLRPGGPVLVNRVGALADALGVARPAVKMDPGSSSVLYAGPNALQIGIGLFSLPARVQDFVLARALARAGLALPFADEPAKLLSELSRTRGLGTAPSVDLLESAAEALAAAVVGDGLGALVGRTLLDPAFAAADPRAWDRAAALAGPGQRGAAAILAAALARLRV